jgi:phage-related baseplate assembly protein
MTSATNLQTLAAPQVLEALDFESILAQHRADLIARLPEVEAVLALESEPLTKLIETHAYRELLYRQRVNAAARANLLAFASGSDLDHKGAFYNVPRLANEADERYRQRIQLRIAALAGNGTAEQYRLLALTASQNVFDAAVFQPTPGSVGVLLWLVDVTAGAQTLAAVQAALGAENARPLGVPVSVSLAVPKPIDIVARLWREPSAPTDLVAQVAAALPAALVGYARLGRPVSRSWVTARLQADGIARVVYPQADAPAEFTALAAGEYPVLGQVQLTDEGIAA